MTKKARPTAERKAQKPKQHVFDNSSRQGIEVESPHPDGTRVAYAGIGGGLETNSPVPRFLSGMTQKTFVTYFDEQSAFCPVPLI
jgi:hypothetical protein